MAGSSLAVGVYQVRIMPMTDRNDKSDLGEEGYFEGYLLAAAPGMSDERFEKSVIYLFSHSDEGAMGIIINQPSSDISFEELLEQLDIPTPDDPSAIQVHNGGPVERGRGFVLHSLDYKGPGSMMNDEQGIGLTATIDVLKAMASGTGPEHTILALGYAGWMAGQLESEIQANGWLIAPVESEIIFGADHDAKWEQTLRAIGADPALLSSTAGRA